MILKCFVVNINSLALLLDGKVKDKSLCKETSLALNHFLVKWQESCTKPNAVKMIQKNVKIEK